MSAEKVKELERRLAWTQAELVHAQERIKALVASNRNARETADTAEAIARDFREEQGLIEATFEVIELPWQLRSEGLESWLGVGEERRKRWRKNFLVCPNSAELILPSEVRTKYLMKRV